LRFTSAHTTIRSWHIDIFSLFRFSSDNYIYIFCKEIMHGGCVYYFTGLPTTDSIIATSTVAASSGLLKHTHSLSNLPKNELIRCLFLKYSKHRFKSSYVKVSWVVTPCTYGYRRFGGIFHLHWAKIHIVVSWVW
jgi:hypothetical protein